MSYLTWRKDTALGHCFQTTTFDGMRFAVFCMQGTKGTTWHYGQMIPGSVNVENTTAESEEAAKQAVEDLLRLRTVQAEVGEVEPPNPGLIPPVDKEVDKS